MAIIVTAVRRASEGTANTPSTSLIAQCVLLLGSRMGYPAELS